MLRRSVGILLDIALIGLVAVVVLTAAVGPLAALSGRTPFVIGGGSMAPAIPKGAIVLVDPPDRVAIETGDVVTFRTPGNVLVTHRVVRVIARPDGIWYETKGDGNAHPDPALWPAASLVGRVGATLPAIGFTSWLFHQPVGWLNVAVLAGWLLMARGFIRGPESFPAAISGRAERHHRAAAEDAETGGLASGASG